MTTKAKKNPLIVKIVSPGKADLHEALGISVERLHALGDDMKPVFDKAKNEDGSTDTPTLIAGASEISESINEFALAVYKLGYAACMSDLRNNPLELAVRLAAIKTPEPVRTDD